MGRHADWRKKAKKCRRSRIRKLRAVKQEELLKQEEEENLKSASYLAWQKEQEALEIFIRNEEDRIQAEENQRWIEQELQAQEAWKQCQEKIAMFKAAKAKQELLIREEWEREQKRIKEIEEKNRQEKEERENQEKEFKQSVENFIAGVRSKLPDGFETTIETKPDKEPCPFFMKVGACRFFENCSRNHKMPSVSKTLLLNNFFTHLSMENKSVQEYDTDMNLEFDEREMYKFFLEFYSDVMPELCALGSVTQFKVCINQSPHLRGNVYVQYASKRDALRAYYALSGRYYGGKRIRAQFCDIPSWSRALCGLFAKRRCPKRGTCNFLHAFRNPTSEFANADCDRIARYNESDDRPRHKHDSSVRSSTWGWSSSDSDNELNVSTRREKRNRRGERRDRESPRDSSKSQSERNRDSSSRKESESSRNQTSSRESNPNQSERRYRESLSKGCENDSKYSKEYCKSRSICTSVRKEESHDMKSNGSEGNCNTWSKDSHRNSERKENAGPRKIKEIRDSSSESISDSSTDCEAENTKNYSESIRRSSERKTKGSEKNRNSENKNHSRENSERRSRKKENNNHRKTKEKETENGCKNRRNSERIKSNRSQKRKKNWKRRKRSNESESLNDTSGDEYGYKHKKQKKR